MKKSSTYAINATKEMPIKLIRKCHKGGENDVRLAEILQPEFSRDQRVYMCACPA